MSSSFPFQGRVGNEQAQDGSYQPFRVSRDGCLIVSEIHGQQYEDVARGNIYTLQCGPTTTGISAGNLKGASAAAAVQLALWNPIGSGVNFSLLKFVRGVVSGTVAAGVTSHGYLSVAEGDTLPTIASTTATLPKNNLVGAPNNSRAKFVSTVASSGTALTGATAVKVLRGTKFSETATALAAASPVDSIEEIDGDIVLAPGSLWLPLEVGAGTSVLLDYSITWAEVPA